MPVLVTNLEFTISVVPKWIFPKIQKAIETLVKMYNLRPFHGVIWSTSAEREKSRSKKIN